MFEMLAPSALRLQLFPDLLANQNPREALDSLLGFDVPYWSASDRDKLHYSRQPGLNFLVSRQRNWFRFCEADYLI
jgi:hypothetical protein